MKTEKEIRERMEWLQRRVYRSDSEVETANLQGELEALDWVLGGAA